MSLDFLKNRSSDRLHTWLVYCGGPPEVGCGGRVGVGVECEVGVAGKRFSRNLQATTREATQSACFVRSRDRYYSNVFIIRVIVVSKLALILTQTHAGHPGYQVALHRIAPLTTSCFLLMC